MVQDSHQAIPDGYRLLDRESPFIQLIGPIYEQPENGGIRLALRTEERHCNMRGDIHGGVISTLADIALGYNIAFSREPALSAVTANLNVDYLGRVSRGDWLEVSTEIQKLGRRLAFASCIFYVADKVVAKASGVFSTMEKAIPVNGKDN